LEAKFGSQLASTVAGVAFGVAGVGTLVQNWQRRRMRERTGPLVAEAIRDVTEACGEMIEYYLAASGTTLSGATAVDGNDLAALLRPPLLMDHADLEWLEKVSRQAFDRMVSLMSDQDPVAPRPEDEQFVAQLHEAFSEILAAETKLQKAVKVLVDYDAPHCAEVLEASMAIGSAVSEQMAAISEVDLRISARSSWHVCRQLLGWAPKIAIGLDLCWKKTRRIAGRKESPLQRAFNSFGLSLDSTLKSEILLNLSLHETKETIKNRPSRPTD
jgi:hypothetical protein